MRYQKSISVLVISIIVLSIVAAGYGILSYQGPGRFEFKSIHGERVPIYGRGLYQFESVTMAAQAKAQDIVTIFLGIPLLIISLSLTKRGLLKGRLLLAGTLGYFLYTYASYSFLAMYNPMFLIYVILLSTSFFAFTLTMMSFDLKRLSSRFQPQTPIKFIGYFLIFLAIIIALMWLGRIVNPLRAGIVPAELGHYTTLVIQALDFAFVVPAAMLAGLLVLRKKPFGYLLASVVIIKGITMLTAISAMIIGMISAGEPVAMMEVVVFPIFNIITILAMFFLLKNVQEAEL